VITSDAYMCTDCGAPCDGMAEQTRCPSCGSVARTRHITVTDTVTATDEVSSLGVEYGTGPRPWQEKWHRVLLGFGKIRQSYSGELNFQSTDEWTDAISSFLGSVHHLHEWIALDTTTPVPARSAARQHLRSDHHLKVAAGFSNTDKHHTRGRGLQVQISSLVCSPTGNRARISWTDLATGDTGQADVLDLSEGCVAAWRDFFAAHGLSTDA